MKMPDFEPPNKVSHPGLPEASYDAMEVLANQVQKITQALQKNMSPEDNENSETRIASFVSGQTYDLNLQEIKGKPTELRVLDNELFENVDVAWEVKDQTTVRVRLTWKDSAPTAPIEATLLIRGAPDGHI